MAVAGCVAIRAMFCLKILIVEGEGHLKVTRLILDLFGIDSTFGRHQSQQAMGQIKVIGL